jgi:uncharacterized protein (DUF2249 family)
MSQDILTLDVREDFRSGEHPCDKIQSALAQLAHGSTLRSLVPFEPLPIFEVAQSKGLGHAARQTPEGDWEVLFSHRPEVEAENTRRATGKTHSCGCGCAATGPAEVVAVDARGLEPPQPMVKILEALAALPDGAAVRAHTDRRPVHLYPILEARGFTCESEPQNDGSFVNHIRRI